VSRSTITAYKRKGVYNYNIIVVIVDALENATRTFIKGEIESVI